MLLLSTTGSIEGKTIKEYKGLVFGEVINGVDFIKDFTAGISNILGGRAGSYEKELISTRTSAVNEMMERAQSLGANAVIGVKVDYETLGQNGSMLMSVASGTAVVVE